MQQVSKVRALDGLSVGSVVHIVNPHVKLKRLNIRNNKLRKK